MNFKNIGHLSWGGGKYFLETQIYLGPPEASVPYYYRAVNSRDYIVRSGGLVQLAGERNVEILEPSLTNGQLTFNWRGTKQMTEQVVMYMFHIKVRVFFFDGRNWGTVIG